MSSTIAAMVDSSASSTTKRLVQVLSTNQTALEVNRDRLMESIHHTAQWGSGERWGKYVINEIILRIDKNQGYN